MVLQPTNADPENSSAAKPAKKAEEPLAPSSANSSGHNQTAREKLARYGFKDETQEVIERGELGVILLGESCVIHLLADNAIPEADMSEYLGQKAGSFFLRQGRAPALIAKLRNSAPPS